MTYEELSTLLDASGIPFAVHHWEHPPATPYGVWFDDSTNNFFADDRTYSIIRHYRVELYIPLRDPEVETRLESALDGGGLCWDKDIEYIKELRLFQISYEIEV